MKDTTELFSNWLGDRITSSPPITGGQFFLFLFFFPNWSFCLIAFVAQLVVGSNAVSPFQIICDTVICLVFSYRKLGTHGVERRRTAQNNCHCHSRIDHLLTCIAGGVIGECMPTDLHSLFLTQHTYCWLTTW